MRIGTADENSTFFAQGLALRDVLSMQGISETVEILVTPISGTQNVARLDAGEIDFGFMAANWLGMSRAGLPPFIAPTDLRVVAPMNAGPMFFVVRADSGLHTIKDLRGKRVAIGQRDSGVAQHARSILGTLGISLDDITPVQLDFPAGADALATGQIDAQLQRPIPNDVMSELDACCDVRVLEYPPGDLEVVLAKCTAYRQTIMRKGALRGLDKDVAQPAVLNLLVTHARVDPELVAKVATACFKGATELAERNALFAGLTEVFQTLKRDGPTALEFDGVGLHTGALDAYRASGLFR